MRNSNRDLFALLLVAAIAIAQGFYAAKLNVDFYAQHGPFFDSCSYTNQLAIVAARTRSIGLLGGIKDSLSGAEGRNVALPFLEMNLLARFIRPTRVLGVWLQSIWMLALALSLYWYFARYRGVDRWLAILMVLPFISFARVYDWDGGLQDFRMDLSLYIFTSLTAVWYLGTYQTESRLPWLLTGISAMLACLARATAPVYLFVMLAPLLAVRFATAPGRRAILKNFLWMFVPPLIAAGGFLAYNFSYLYFYYVTWNPAANEHLPWKQSYLHFHLAGSHVGVVLKWCSLAALAIDILCIRGRIPRLDWKPIWLAVIVPFFLAYRGAGITPFVSISAVFGYLLFVCLPFEGIQPAARFLWARASIGILLTAGAIASAAAAGEPQPYSDPDTSSMPGVRTMIDRASQDARARGLPRVDFIAPELGECHSCMIKNILIYEYGAVPGEDKALYVPGGLVYRFPEELTFMAPDELFWKMNVKGNSNEERLNNVVSMMAAESPAYLFLPDEATLAWLEHDRSFYFINHHTRQIMARLLALNRWVSLGEAIQVDPFERLVVYAPR